MPNTVKLKKYVDIIEEYPAHDANILPGHLLTLLSTGKVDGHTAAEGIALPMFALEDELQGRGIDTAYAANQPVQVWVPVRGEQVNAILKAGQKIAIGDFLVSAGNGELQRTTEKESMTVESIGTVEEMRETIVGVALQAVDLTGSSGVYSPTAHVRRIRIRVM